MIVTKRKVKAIPEYRAREATRDMGFAPTTPLGSTRLEMRNQGPFRPDKTRQDYLPVQERPRFKAWQARLSKAQTQPKTVAA